MSSPLIRATDLHKVYRVKSGRKRVTRRALTGASVEIHPGQRVALVGANGSGKSTLLRMLASIEEPDSGSVAHTDDAGNPIDRAAAALRMGVVFQTPGLDRLLTVEENLRTQADLYGVANPLDRVRECASSVGLLDRLHDRVGVLSGGLARRADLARAMISAPSLLLLDEPLAGLDAESRDVFLSRLRGLAESDRNFTLVMSSHLPEEIRQADVVVVLDGGRVVASGDPGDIARSTFQGCSLLAIADGSPSDLEGVDRLRCWTVGGQTIIGGDREAVERIAIRQSREGIAVELREPDFAIAYRLMLSESSREAVGA